MHGLSASLIINELKGSSGSSAKPINYYLMFPAIYIVYLRLENTLNLGRFVSATDKSHAAKLKRVVEKNTSAKNHRQRQHNFRVSVENFAFNFGSLILGCKADFLSHHTCADVYSAKANPKIISRPNLDREFFWVILWLGIKYTFIIIRRRQGMRWFTVPFQWTNEKGIWISRPLQYQLGVWGKKWKSVQVWGDYA